MRKIFILFLTIILGVSVVGCSTMHADAEPPYGQTLEERIETVIAEIEASYQMSITKFGNGRDDISTGTFSTMLRRRVDTAINKISDVTTEDEIYLIWEDLVVEEIRLKELFTDQIERLNGEKPSFLFTGEIDGDKFEVWHHRAVPSGQYDWQVVVNSESKEFACVFLADKYEIAGQKEGSEDKTGVLPMGSDVVIADCSKTGGFLGSVIIKNGVVRGYSVFDYNVTWSKTVVFDLQDGQQITVEQVRSFMGSARDGVDGEAKAGIRIKPGKMEINKSNRVMINEIFPINFGSPDDNPEIRFDKINDENLKMLDDIELKVYSDVPFTYCGEEVTEAKVSLGESVYWTDEGGKSGVLGVLIRQNNKIIGLYGVKIVAKKSESYDKPIMTFEIITCTFAFKEDNSGFESIPEEYVVTMIDVWANG